MIWYVDFGDLSCAWTKREDAVNYVHEEAKRLQADIKITDGAEYDPNYGYVEYIITYKEYDNSTQIETVTIINTFLDEKPYWD